MPTSVPLFVAQGNGLILSLLMRSMVSCCAIDQVGFLTTTLLSSRPRVITDQDAHTNTNFENNGLEIETTYHVYHVVASIFLRSTHHNKSRRPGRHWKQFAHVHVSASRRFDASRARIQDTPPLCWIATAARQRQQNEGHYSIFHIPLGVACH